MTPEHIGNGMVETNMYGRKDPQARDNDQVRDEEPEQIVYTVCESCGETFEGYHVLVYDQSHFCCEGCLKDHLRDEADEEVSVVRLLEETT